MHTSLPPITSDSLSVLFRFGFERVQGSKLLDGLSWEAYRVAPVVFYRTLRGATAAAVPPLLLLLPTRENCE